MAGHAGAVLLHRTADRVGLSAGLRGAPASSPWMLDRANALVGLIVGIALGARSARQGELLARHHAALLGDGASDSTLWRALGEIDDRTRLRIARARARIRAQVWDLPADRVEGFPWLVVLGKELAGWVVIDLDATIITASSKKQGAAGTYEGSYGFHPLAAWCANTFETLAMMLRPGNAGSNTVADHLAVIADALTQVPRGYRAKILIRIDGARWCACAGAGGAPGSDLAHQVHHLLAVGRAAFGRLAPVTKVGGRPQCYQGSIILERASGDSCPS